MVSIVELNHINSPTIVWDKLTVNQDISVEGPEFNASISEETLACLHILHAGSQTKQSYLQGSRKRIDMLSIICKSGKDSEQIARHDVVIDHSIPFGEVALPFYSSALLQTRPGETVYVRLVVGEDGLIECVKFKAFSESLYACGNDLVAEYLLPAMVTGQLFHDGQILPFKSDKHDTVLLVQISKLKLEGAESDRKVEELFGIVSGRVKKNIEVLLDERSPIPFNHVYQFDDQESVDLGDSEDEDHDRASAIHVAAT